MGANLNRGNSLLEMLIVLVIIGMISTSAFPKMRANRLRTEIEVLSVSIHELFSRARTSESELKLFIDRKAISAKDKTGRILLDHKLAQPVVVLSAPQSIRFSPSGIVSPLSVRISDGRASCNIVVSLRGRIRKQC